MFTLRKLIGAGAFGEIWKCDYLGESNVAIKISYHPISHDLVQRERYLYQRIASLSLPHMISIRAILEYDRRLAIVMELADQNLLEHLGSQTTGIPTPLLLTWLQQVATTCDVLHRANIVHAGINPTDILLANGVAKLSDLGLSHHLTDQGVISYPLRIVKSLCMAPELKKGVVKPQSDQYALAVTYCWLRLGTPPCASTGGIGFPLLPPAERAVLSKALADNLNDRYESCTAFASALLVS